MLDKNKIKELFSLLNDRLAEKGEVGEVGLVGGAVMCLVFNARKSTKDVDGIFEPAAVIRKLAAQIGEETGVGSLWLNDGAKAYIQGQFGKQDVLVFPSLRVWAPEATYMLAMKCISARWDTSDKDDVEFLIKYLKLKTPKQVFKIIEKYYAKNLIKPKTQFMIEELLQVPGT